MFACSRPAKLFAASFVAVCLSALVGCAAKRTVLATPPDAALATAPKFRGELAQADGVRIIAAPNDWNGRPADLGTRITPIRVRIENHSGRPLRISYDEFSIQGPNNKTFAALPPAHIKGNEYVGDNFGFPRQPTNAALVYAALDPQTAAPPTPHVTAPPPSQRIVVVPDFDYDDYYTAPYWSYGYDGLSPWPYAWGPDWGYYNTYSPYMARIHLPTQSMLRKAIPEGVIANGGHIAGFLYFQKVNNDEKEVNLVAKLVDARSGQQFGQLSLPFVVQK